MVQPGGGWRATGFWQDVCELPETLQATLDRGDGLDATVDLLTRDRVRRIVVTGNGAAYHCALALGLACLGSQQARPEVVAVPSGLLAQRWFSWRPGDVVLAISSSGEFRDIVRAIEDHSLPQPFAAITCSEGSTIARHASERVLVQVSNQRAITHTQAFCGNVLAALALWARIAADKNLRRAVDEGPEACSRSLRQLEDGDWPRSATEVAIAARAAIAFGSGGAWVGALEAALLLKEVAQIPAEGNETREAATLAITVLAPGQLAISIPTEDDPFISETEALCARTGATVLRIPGGSVGDNRLAPITTFPAAAALAASLGTEVGINIDAPPWVDAYYDTAR